MTRAILVVDDEPEMRIAISKAISMGGFRVESASNGYEAIAKMKQSFFDLILTDLRMPKMDGVTLLGQIKSLSPESSVVLITAYGTIENAVEAMKLGADDYILKPFSFEILNNVIEKVLDRKNEAYRSGTDADIPYKKEIITKNSDMAKLLLFAKSIAVSNATVLIQGESGTGKELLARYIHQESDRRNMPFVAINCASLPEGLLESELFGHEKGAFTGAVARKEGKFELANDGTLMLDEITEMKYCLQAKLLRAIQEGEIDRVGGRNPVKINTRIIATTNRDIKECIKNGEFRQDLFYRLNVIPLRIPSLSKRVDDIPFLAEYFLKKSCERNKRNLLKLSSDALASLENHSWPGNVREFENLIERAVLLCEGDNIEPEHLLFDYNDDSSCEESSDSLADDITIHEMEKRLIVNTLKKVNGNRTKAASILQISIRTLRNKLREYQISQ